MYRLRTNSVTDDDITSTYLTIHGVYVFPVQSDIAFVNHLYLINFGILYEVYVCACMNECVLAWMYYVHVCVYVHILKSKVFSLTAVTTRTSRLFEGDGYGLSVENSNSVNFAHREAMYAASTPPTPYAADRMKEMTMSCSKGSSISTDV